ncbi:YbjN domain-containing protein [Spirulina sp. CS-785/01]|uniref:YbjN domain-containing protein n=1 Tax=Spirulina sp. CS-785/01 TaxID=3021716 RepID=UPI00232AD271|nr:YbjN domain-containing protein [Spirulina sp. CS-785/01]MDB9313579.1 YbjN domain-containing protein [Spirulina sp. CS-785/01]
MDKQAIQAILNSEKCNLFDNSAIASHASQPLEMSMIDAVIHYFTIQGWDYAQEESNLLHSTFQVQEYQWDCYIQSFEAQKQLLIYSIVPAIAPQYKRAAILELTTRINYDLVIGSFDVELQSGYISYKTSLDITESYLDLALLKNLFQANLETVVYYLPAFQGVIQDDLSPLEARLPSEDASGFSCRDAG